MTSILIITTEYLNIHDINGFSNKCHKTDSIDNLSPQEKECNNNVKDLIILKIKFVYDNIFFLMTHTKVALEHN